MLGLRRGGRWLSLGLAALLVGGVAAAAEPGAPSPCTDPDGAGRVSLAWAEANRIQDLERVVALYDDEAIMQPPGQPPSASREAIRSYYKATFARGHLVEFTSHQTSCRAAGEFVLITADNQGRVTKADGTSRTFNSKFLLVLRRLADGSWRIYRDIWNESPTPSPAGHQR